MSMSNYTKKTNCVCCDKSDLSVILDLNKQPLANSYHTEDEKLEEYPLGLNLCKDCYHLQLTHIVNPDLLFKDYLYVSGTSQTLKDNFEWFSNFTLEYANNCRWTWPNPQVESVLDIACNDGSQLDCFKSKGIETYGIDPAENLYELSSKNHNIVCDHDHKTGKIRGYICDNCNTGIGRAKDNIKILQNWIEWLEKDLEL